MRSDKVNILLKYIEVIIKQASDLYGTAPMSARIILHYANKIKEALNG